MKTKLCKKDLLNEIDVLQETCSILNRRNIVGSQIITRLVDELVKSNGGYERYALPKDIVDLFNKLKEIE